MSNYPNPPYPVNPDQSGYENLIGLINAAHESADLSLADVSFGPIQTPNGNRSALVQLQGLNGRGYKGSVTIAYDRISLEGWASRLNRRLIVDSFDFDGQFITQAEALLSLLPGSLMFAGTPDDTDQYATVKIRPDNVAQTDYVFYGQVDIEKGMPTVPGGSESLGRVNDIRYLGEVPSESLIRGDDLARQLGLDEGYAVNDEVDWLKFSVGGEITFMPKRNIRREVTWQTLYAKGLVYDTDGFGEMPDQQGGVDQNRVVSIRGHNYRVRLMTAVTPNGFEIDPGGEFQAIFDNLIHNDNFGRSFTWEELDLDNNQYRFWTQDGVQYTSGSRVTASAFRQTEQDPFSLRVINTVYTAVYYWRPMLVLADA